MARATFPRRDPDGRVARFGEFVVAAVVWLVVAFVALTVIDVLSSLVGIGDVGSSRGWLVAVLAVWLFVEDFRAWRGTRSRAKIGLLAALVALLVGLAAGYGMAWLAPGLPSLVTGSVAATVAVLAYAPVWFYGIRWAE